MATARLAWPRSITSVSTVGYTRHWALWTVAATERELVILESGGYRTKILQRFAPTASQARPRSTAVAVLSPITSHISLHGTRGDAPNQLPREDYVKEHRRQNS
jgi:hypothetical protein